MLLKLCNLSKQHNEGPGIHNLHLDIGEGDAIAIHAAVEQDGELLFELLTRQVEPTAGTITILGTTKGQRLPIELVGFQNQGFGTYKRLTVREYLELFCDLHGLPPKHYSDIAEQVGLSDRLNTFIRSLTHEFILRVHLARALLHQPKLLILRNPTVGVSADSTELLRRALLASVSQGTGLLVITSSLEEAEALGQIIYTLRNGQISLVEEKHAKSGEETEHVRFNARRIAAKVDDRTLLFDPTEIIYACSEEGSTVLYYEGGNAPCPLTLAELEKRLTPFGFFRCHRAYLVNLQRIREVVPWTRSSFSLILDDKAKTSIPMSKNAVKELESILGLREDQ